MLTQRQLERYADVLLWGLRTARKRRFKKGDILLIRSDPAGMPLAETVFDRGIAQGMQPVFRTSPTPFMEEVLFQKGDRRQIRFIPPGDEELFRRINGSVLILAPESLTHLSGVDPETIAAAAAARKRFRDIMAEREASGDLGWTLCVYPTAALARNAGLPPEVYANQIIRACFLNRRDPVAHWRHLHQRAQAIKKRLNRMRIARLHIESDTIDLVVTPGEQRQWIGISGRNIPSFEIFMSPDWRGTRGVFYADQPSYRSGNRIAGVRLEFQKGRVVAAAAEEGEGFLKSQLSMDAGASRVGEFSLTDVRFSKIDRFMANTLFDENFGGRYGNSHIALGSSYANSFSGPSSRFTAKRRRALGFNDSALHWDLVNTQKKRVTAQLSSGKRRVIYENGRFRMT